MTAARGPGYDEDMDGGAETGRARWMRAALTGPSAMVVLMATMAALGLRALGRALDAAVDGGSLLGLARDVLLVAATLSAIVLAIRWMKSRRMRVRATLPALAVVAALFALGWKLTLRAAPYHDFHGVFSQSASSRWVESHPLLPRVTYRLNRHGFRGADFEEKKAPGVVRVALVGDSFIFGKGVEESETLKARLDAILAARGLAGRVEVLDLGIPGTNLPTHVRMVEIAQEVLGADVVVMGLFEHNDMTEWDVEDEIAGLSRPSVFSLGSFLLGERPAVVLAGVIYLLRGCASADAAFDRIIPRLEALRAKEGAPPLIVLDYWTHHERVKERFSRMKGVVFIPTAVDGRPEESLHIPEDGHPSAHGNEVFAGMVAERLVELPVIASLVTR
ncbi:MAG: hypothetical protein U0359_33450 [Byssovorax sp.]